MTPDEGQMVAEVIVETVRRSLEPVLARLAAVEARQLIAGPPGPQGERGERGQDGAHGAPGAKGLDGARGADGLRGEPGPPGERGLDGRDGRDGKDGKDGRDGTDGAPGAPGEKGQDGSNGRDGFGLEDFQVAHDGERGLTLSFIRGELVKSHELVLPALIYRGVFDAEKAYQPGDVVTWGGHAYVAKMPTRGPKPGLASEDSRAWQLAVKAGRDGREGKTGPEGPQGPPGTQGTPGRNAY